MKLEQTADGSYTLYVPELDEHIVARTDAGQHLVPTSFVDEALGTASVLCMVIHLHRISKEVLEHHSPTTLGTTLAGVLIGHGRVSYHKDSSLLLTIGKGGKCNK